MKLLNLFFKHPSYALLLIFIIGGNSAFAQLQADFVPAQNGGCSPLAISFANTTTGASLNAVYTWDFGNGNTSVLKNSSAVFYTEKSYTVSLTVIDGAKTSVKTRTVTVYKKPAADFNYAPVRGCLPLPVLFNNTSVAGDGNLSSSYWDFGDGQTQQSYGQQTSHFYTFPQTASVTLTVANEYGCTNAITKKDVITVLPAIQAHFATEKTIYCAVTDQVRFTNSSNGPGILSYTWDFGDGNTSALQTPSHVYNTKGNYTVTLTVNSSEGCSSTMTAYLNIANFKSDFEPPAVLCNNSTLLFYNTSSPVPDYAEWSIDGYYTSTTFGNEAMRSFFSADGIHTIQLTNNFGSCQQTISRQININASINAQSFIATGTSLCGAPSEVNFKDTTTGAVKWLWSFNTDYNAPSSTLKEPSYTYPSDGSNYVTLTVTNAAGCSSSTAQYVNISKPLVGIFPAGNFAGCDSLALKLTTRSTEEITNFKWNFGDGSPLNTTDKEPEHLYKNPGIYTVTLSYTTINGCTGTTTYNSVSVYKKPKAAFISTPVVCGNSPVYFGNLSTGDLTHFMWDFGDGTNNSDGFHKFQAEGIYTVRLIAFNDFCSDTIEKQNIIKVSPPFPAIGQPLNTCDGTRGTVTFADASRQAESWRWDFGDGTQTAYTSAIPEIQHTYSKTGSYKVVLTTTNGACTVKDSVTVYVLLKQSPVLSAAGTNICNNGSLSLTVAGMQASPYPPLYFPYGNNYYFLNAMQYEDGSYFNGSPYLNGVWAQTASLTVTNIDPSKTKLRVISNSAYFGCADTTNYVPINTGAGGPVPDFHFTSSCFREAVVFTDVSKAATNSTIKKWEWDFGDGQTQTLTTAGSTTHKYNRPGYYNVVLKVTDARGCSANTNYYSNQVTLEGPMASFSPSGTNVPLNTTISFYNSTITLSSNVNYKWDFGDGQTATDISPDHTYPVAGTYIIQLIAINNLTQCSDTTRQTIIVRNFNTAFSTSASFIGNGGRCAPALASFVNTSSNYTRIVWDFGDGFTLENQNYPSHIYKEPGKYIVTLYVYGYNGLTGQYIDSIVVSEPAATIKTDVTAACTGTPVKLNSPQHSNTVSYAWDFGDGHVINATDSFAVNKYLYAGSYSPSLVVTNENGCSVAVPLAGPIVIYPEPVVHITPVNPFLCKGNSVELNATGGVSYIWSPAEGLSATQSSSVIASPANTTTYSLQVKDDKGCTGNNQVTVTVAQPFTIHSSPDAAICAGSTVQLNTTGALSYKWINETDGLNNVQIPNPLASPAATVTYTVVGYDANQCFTDTAFVKITVNPIPLINAGPDIETIIGTELQLNPVASNDVVKWAWSPADYLNCTSCASPVSRPRSPVEYTVTVQNEFNCSAKDNLKINVVCASGEVYIPSAFSPNNDGKNDRFVILGNGVRIVKSLRIYNRWGNIIFEHKNFYPDDRNAAWDGTYKGIASPAGTYVYIAEMECNANETFVRKGTVTLVR